MDEDLAATRWAEEESERWTDPATQMLALVFCMAFAFVLGLIVMALIWWAV